MKKFLAGILAGCLLATSFSVVADTVIKNAEIRLNYTKLTIDGKPSTSETLLYNDTLYIPLSNAAKELGFSTAWNSSTNTTNISTSSSTKTVSGNDKAIPTQIPTPTPESTMGSRTNPYTANNTATLELKKFSSDNNKYINLTVENVISGTEANSIINSENRFNKKPEANQEWRIYTFNLKYTSGNENDVLEASDIIFDRYFFNQQGQSMIIHDTATLGDKYGAYGVSKVKLYPSGSSKVVYAILTNINEGIPLIQVQYDSGNKSHWISCDAKSASSSGTSVVPSPVATAQMYSDCPTVPDYGAYFGISRSNKMFNSNITTYLYSAISIVDAGIDGTSASRNYHDLLISCGYEKINSYNTISGVQLIYKKGDIGVSTGLVDLNIVVTIAPISILPTEECFVGTPYKTYGSVTKVPTSTKEGSGFVYNYTLDSDINSYCKYLESVGFVKDSTLSFDNEVGKSLTYDKGKERIGLMYLKASNEIVVAKLD